MNIVLWIVQILLALMFLLHGRMMLAASAAQPAATQPATAQAGTSQTATPQANMMAYIQDIPPGFRRFIGVAEVLAAAGLILPGLTGILPWLTPLAAAGLVIVMIGAVIFHIPRHENPNLIFNLILLVLSAFVAYMRWFVLPL